MIRLHCEFDTYAEAVLWTEGMYRAYPPEGYSTHIRIEKVTKWDGRFQDTETVWLAFG